MARVLDVDSHWTFPWDFQVEHGPLKRFGHQQFNNFDLCDAAILATPSNLLALLDHTFANAAECKTTKEWG